MDGEGRRPDPPWSSLGFKYPGGLGAEPPMLRAEGPRFTGACHEAILGHQVEGGSPSVGRRLPLPVNSIVRGKPEVGEAPNSSLETPSKSVITLTMAHAAHGLRLDWLISGDLKWHPRKLALQGLAGVSKRKPMSDQEFS